MAIGERIHFFRIMRGMTQKYLGMLVGFPERSADVRLAQYETGSRQAKGRLDGCTGAGLLTLRRRLLTYPTLTVTSGLCTPYLPLRTFTVLPSVNQTVKSA